MTIARTVMILFGLMIIANGIFDGAVKDSVVEIATSDEKQEMRNTFYCLAGLMMYPPVREVWGVNIPIPSLDDLIVAGALTSMLLFILHTLNQKVNWKHALGIFFVVWLAYRMVGLFFIHMSGDGCQSVMADMASTMTSLATVSSIFGVGIIYKVFRAAKV